MDMKYKLKALTMSTIFTCYLIILGIFLYAYFAGGMQYQLIFHINRYGESTLELLLFIVTIPGCYYLWTENLSKKAVKRSDEIQELLDSLRWQPEEKEEAEG